MAWVNAKKGVRIAALRQLLGNDDLSDLSVLEFGAFASPTLEPGEADVHFADRLSTEELRTSVRESEKRAAIVPVEFVVDSNFDETIKRQFQLVIANHVIEHVPDVIGWLDRMSRILTPGGHLFLAVPDKNFTFDIMRDPTLVRELIENHEVGRTKPPLSAILDARCNRRPIDRGDQVWSGQAHIAIAQKPQLDVAGLIEEIRNSHTAGGYIDTHCNVFTEASFLRVFQSLTDMGITKLRLISTYPVQRPYNEFYALFEKP